jgi:hypothetical protein
MHCAIVCVDVEAFGNWSRTNLDQIAVRSGLYRALQDAFDLSGVPWIQCYHEDRGDGAFVLVPPDVPKNRLIAGLPQALVEALKEHNQAHRPEARIRLRMAIHAGEVHRDDHGAAGTALNHTFRLLGAEALREALSLSSAVVAMIASQWFFEEVVRHDPANHPDRYRRVSISVKETDTAAWIFVPSAPDPGHEALGTAYTHDQAPWSTAKAFALPRQLPPAPAQFTGRAAALTALTRLMDESSVTGLMPMIAVIEGTAGIGKTALAVRWAHQEANRFPDGQLYLNLRGFHPTGRPVAPPEAIRGFLDAFGVPDERIPVSATGQGSLYRSIIASRRMLILLDNARDTEQVRPLLPSFPGCVLVTSRSQLTGLITAEGARPLPLGLLTIEEARQLLANRLGAERVSAEPGPVEEIISSCARLPLTLSIAAARAATHPGFALSTIATELRDAQGGLDVFEGGELDTDARAVFSWSYKQLDNDSARLFRQLALHPGPDITVPAAASLAGVSPKKVRRTMDVLARCHLIDESSPGRFTFHDLLRAYGSELAHTHDAQDERAAAIGRMLDHYLHTASNANVQLYPRTEPVPVSPPSHGTTIQEIVDPRAGWTWFEVELPVLLAIVQLAATTGHGAHAWQLPCMLVEYFRRSGHWESWAAIHRTGLAAAERSGDRYGQARMHQGIGRVAWRLGRYEEAHFHLQQALDMFAEIDSRVAEIVGTHLALSTTFEHLNANADALIHAEEALALSRAADDRLWQARALNRVGWYHALLGRPDQALTECQEALAEIHDLGDRSGEARTLDSVAYAYHLLGDHEQAIAYFVQSLALRHELSDRHGEATVLTHLGDTYKAAGNLPAAHTAWNRAVMILTEIAHPDVADVDARLHN